MEHLLTLEEVASMFGISEDEVLDLVERGIIPSYKVAGVYLRFKSDKIEEVKDRILQALESGERKIDKSKEPKASTSIKDVIWDFFYFYDYYIAIVIIIGFLVYLIAKN